jgi:hypothetical protein
MQAVVEPGGVPAITLHLPGDASVEVTHRSQMVLASQLIQALRSTSC